MCLDACCVVMSQKGPLHNCTYCGFKNYAADKDPFSLPSLPWDSHNRAVCYLCNQLR